MFDDCYRPQIAMRIVFTCYAINAAALCFILTLALSFIASEETIERVAVALFTYTYIAFGPLLLIFCIYGLIFIRGLMFQCDLTHITGRLNLMDVLIIVGCGFFSALVTLFFSMHKAVEMAQISLRDENSVFYRLFLRLLKYKR